MGEVGALIKDIGFPIFSYLVSAWFIKYTYDHQMQREEKHDQRDAENWAQLTQLTQAVNENSQTLREMVRAINGEE